MIRKYSGTRLSPQGTERIRKKVINKCKDQTHEYDPQVYRSRMDDVIRHLQKSQERIGKNNKEQGDNCRKYQPAQHGRTDLALQLIVFLRPVLGAHQDPGAHAHAAYKKNDHIHDRPAVPTAASASSPTISPRSPNPPHCM